VIGENSIVFEVGSTAPICEAVTNHPKISSQHTYCRHGEFSGPSAAIKAFMKVKPISSASGAPLLNYSRKVGTFKAMGMRIRYMDPKRMINICLCLSLISH
jgi:hypothetical protein